MAAGSRSPSRSRRVLAGAEHGRERRAQIVRDRGQQRLAQPVGFGGALGPVEVFHQAHALDGQRAHVDERVQQPAALGGEDRAGLVGVEAHHADGAATRAHGQEQALGAGQGVGAAAGSAVVVEGPFGGGEIGLVEAVLGWVACPDAQPAVPRQTDLPEAAARRGHRASPRPDRRWPRARRRASRSRASLRLKP